MGGEHSSISYNINTYTDKIFQHNIVECKYVWTVANFRNLAFTVGKCITSQRLKIDVNGTRDEWEIALYPGGYSERTADFLSVWLRRVSTTERLVEFTCEIWCVEQLKCEEGKAFVKKTIKEKLSLESVLGWSAFCKRSHILAEDNGILEEGNLILLCTLQIFDNKCIPHPAVEDEDPNMDETMSELSENFNQLLQSKSPCDVTFKFNGELLHAHKAILCSRSTVFPTMFDLELRNNVKNITIKDISKDTFLAMLQFIYSGKLNKVDFDTSMELYYAADKYKLMSLRRICSKNLVNSLNTENAVHVIALSNRHGDIVLKDICVNYIARNAAEVQKRLDWLDLMKSSPDLANEVFRNLSQLNFNSK